MSCRRAVLTLLPKKGNLQDIKNWRPVSLLCVDYKLLSKALANRLRGAMVQVIHWDQTYCVPGRSMVDNAYLIRDVLEVSSSLGIDTGLISLDQEKAFDRVEHNFLWKVMERFGFSAGFIAKIKVLYSDIETSIGKGLSDRPPTVWTKRLAGETGPNPQWRILYKPPLKKTDCRPPVEEFYMSFYHGSRLQKNKQRKVAAPELPHWRGKVGYLPEQKEQDGEQSQSGSAILGPDSGSKSVRLRAGMASSETPSLSLRHGVRVQPDPAVPVEAVLLAVGDRVGHANDEQRMEDCNRDCVDELLQGLPQLGPEDRAVLDANISLEEITAAVGQMAPGMAGPSSPHPWCLHQWLFEEPLFGNNFIISQVLSSLSLKSRLREVGCVKLGHLMKISITSYLTWLSLLLWGSGRIRRTCCCP
ncbi:hypothetical protein L3Q82_021473 [Scortum barcoo]|uniref:Uncharacterized protein n=1 Tax=Scortum barcoo TaxID=214431 RepID=A0ACB8X7Q0_9TELE|nr:hypothetical protein L3Q82_021473 [Scortum barcoo]